jgi:hypothetical protein
MMDKAIEPTMGQMDFGPTLSLSPKPFINFTHQANKSNLQAFKLRSDAPKPKFETEQNSHF